MKDVVQYRTGKAKFPKYSYISTENMLQNCQGISPYAENEIQAGNMFKQSDILLGNIRPYLKKMWLASFDGSCSSDVLVLEPKRINSEYLKFILSNEKFFTYVMSGAKGSKMPRGDKKHILEYEIYVPNITEQNKVAKFLSLVDKRIEKQCQLVENLKKYKRGLLNAIFEQKIRFKDKDGKDFPEWEKIFIKNIFKERSERSDNGVEELLSVTINNGVQRRNTIEQKDNSSDDKSNYKKVFIGDIAYNSMRMWQGASGYSPYNGIISPAYTVITPINIDETCLEFWAYYFKLKSMLYIFQKYSQGLTSDTWNLKYPQLSQIKVLRPNFEEQTLIAKILLILDKHIKTNETYLEQLCKIKTGLLQQMFI